MMKALLKALVALAGALVTPQGASFLERLAGKAKIAGLGTWADLLAGLPRMVKMASELAMEYVATEPPGPMQSPDVPAVGVVRREQGLSAAAAPQGSIGKPSDSHPSEGKAMRLKDPVNFEGPPSHPDEGAGIEIPTDRIPGP